MKRNAKQKSFTHEQASLFRFFQLLKLSFSFNCSSESLSFRSTLSLDSGPFVPLHFFVLLMRQHLTMTKTTITENTSTDSAINTGIKTLSLLCWISLDSMAVTMLGVEVDGALFFTGGCTDRMKSKDSVGLVLRRKPVPFLFKVTFLSGFVLFPSETFLQINFCFALHFFSSNPQSVMLLPLYSTDSDPHNMFKQVSLGWYLHFLTSDRELLFTVHTNPNKGCPFSKHCSLNFFRPIQKLKFPFVACSAWDTAGRMPLLTSSMLLMSVRNQESWHIVIALLKLAFSLRTE